MKRGIIFMALLISISACAQEQKFTFGPSVNAGISQILFQKSDTIPSHTITNRLNFSFQAGAFLNFRFVNRFSVGMEVQYWMQNGKVKDGYNYTDVSSGDLVSETDIYKATVSYVALPVFFQYYLNGVVLLLGGQYGISFGQSGTKQINTAINGITTEGDKVSHDPNFANYDVGIKAGLLYKLSDHLTGGVEYYNGRVNLSQNNTDPYTSHNQYFYVAFRYNIITGKKEKMYYN